MASAERIRQGIYEFSVVQRLVVGNVVNAGREIQRDGHRRRGVMMGD
jgi:hypothetical protein